jgi:hypothetical protein
MRSIFERGVPLGEHVGSCAVGASHLLTNSGARFASAQCDGSRHIALQLRVVVTSRNDFNHCKQMLARSAGATTGPPE